MRIFHITDTFTENMYLFLKAGCSISQCIEDSMRKEARLMIQSGFTRNQIEELKNKHYYDISRILQLILYICSINKDVNENEEQKKIYRKSNGSPKDVFREVRKWDVGYRIGNTIRQYQHSSKSVSDVSSSDNQSSEKKSTAKRPHSRKGHYHHFWVGSKKDNSRKLVLKWIAPMFINGGQDDIVATVHSVKSAKHTDLMLHQSKKVEDTP